MVLVGSSYMSPIICSILCVIISCLSNPKLTLYVPFCSIESPTCYNDVPYGTPKTTVHLGFSSHTYYKNPISKRLTFPSTNNAGIIPFSYHFYTILNRMTWCTPHLQEIRQDRELFFVCKWKKSHTDNTFLIIHSY